MHMSKLRIQAYAVYHTLQQIAAVFTALVVLLSALPAHATSDAAPALGECSDEALRIETRLFDLGYLWGMSDGVWREDDLAALTRFARERDAEIANALSLLFANASSERSQAQTVTLHGTRMPWDEVENMLTIGSSYTVTSCNSGIMLHMVCSSLGSHAMFYPEIPWDEATLVGFFNAYGSMETQPVTLSVNGIRIAASLQASPTFHKTGMRLYHLFFFESTSEIGGLPDAAHQATIEIAAAG